ncbi:MAG: hypothetical protein PVI86_14155, partial [Phycisphaerae bacterium]
MASRNRNTSGECASSGTAIGWRAVPTARLARAGVAVLGIATVFAVVAISYTIGGPGDPPPWSCQLPPLEAGAARAWHVDIPITPYSSVNTNTGNTFTEIPIVGWTGFGPPFQFSLYHNAASVDLSVSERTAGTGFDLGPGWSCSYSSHLVFVDPVTTILVHDDGTEDEYHWSAGEWNPPAGVHDELQRCTGSPTPDYCYFEGECEGGFQWAVKHVDQSWDWYCDQAGTGGRLIGVFDPLSQYVEVVWENDRIEAIIDASGRELDLQFDPSDRLDGIFDPCDPDDPGDACNRTWRLCYHDDDRIRALIDPLPYEYELLFEYDTDGRVSYMSVDKEANPAWGTGCESTCEGEGTEDCCSAHGSTGCNDVDCCALVCGEDNFCCVVSWDATCADAANESCAVCGITPAGFTYTYYTDSGIEGRLQQVVDPLFQTQGFALACPAEGVMAGTYTDERGSDWAYEHDFDRNLTATVDPLDHTQTFDYDADRNLVSYKDALENEWTFSYDDRGNMLSRTADPGGLDITETWQYDDCEGECNNLRFYTDGENKTIEYLYERTGYPTLLTEIVEPATAQGPSAIFLHYDAPWSGKPSKIVRGAPGSERAPTRFEFDTWGQLHRRISGALDRTLRETTIRNTVGLVRNYIAELGDAPPRASSGGSASYDSHGRAVSSACMLEAGGAGSPPAGHPPLPSGRAAAPTIYGELDIPPNGYSPRDELLTANLTIGDSRLDPNETFSRRFENSYDDLGRPMTSRILSNESGYQAWVGLQYDFDWTSGEYTRSDFDDEPSDDVVTTVQYDVANRVTSFLRENPGSTIVLSAAYTYFDNDQLDTVTFGNGTSTSYEYDAARRVTAIEHKHGSTQLLRLEYTYDDRNLVTHIDEYDDGDDVADVDFDYDARGRLTSDVRDHTGDLSRSYNLAYEYDPAGNRETKTETLPFGNKLITTYHYDHENPNWQSDYNQLMYSETCQTSGGMFGMMGPMGPGGGGGGPCVDVSKTYYYYNDEGNVTNVFTENLAPVGGEKPYSSTALVYAKNNRTVTFAVGEEWTDETDYEALWGREYRYDQARARYLRTVLGPEELENGNFVGTDTWSQYGERSERKRA